MRRLIPLVLGLAAVAAVASAATAGRTAVHATPGKKPVTRRLWSVQR